MTTLRSLFAVVASLVLACGAGWAQQYPTKPVRVIIVFPPGGGTDIVGRILFQKVSEQLNQQFVVDNRAGAGGTIGAAIVARVRPTVTRSWCTRRRSLRTRNRDPVGG